MKSHKLAELLLDMPDCEVVLREEGDALYSVDDINHVLLLKSNCHNLFFDFNNYYDDDKEAIAAIELK